MTADEKKIKQLINSSREDQVIGIHLMVYTMRWSIEDCALFYFLNTKPRVFEKKELDIGYPNWQEVSYEVGFYDIFCFEEERIRDTTINSTPTTPIITSYSLIPKETQTDNKNKYRFILLKYIENLTVNHLSKKSFIINKIYSMNEKFPILEFISEAIKLNLNK